MVNAATDIQYNGKFYKEGQPIPDELVTIFKLKDPSLLADHIEINAKWIPISSPTISGFVEENKNKNKRIINFLKQPEVEIVREDIGFIEELVPVKKTKKKK